MFLVTGITGNVGGAAARHLLTAGRAVRALVRDAAKAATWAGQGVELVKGEWQDGAGMARAMEGVEGAYLMMPPVGAPSADFREAKAVIAGYTEALAKASPPKLVVLSSIGSEKPSGLGLITSTHLLEEALQDITVPIAYIRAGSFYENYAFGLQSGLGGVLPTFYAPTDRKLPMVATEDIGSLAAQLLQTEWTGKRIIELGSMASPDDLAAAIGQILGRDVTAQAIPKEAWAGALEGMGLPKGGTWAYEEMIEGVNSGWIGMGVAGTERIEGRTTAHQVFSRIQQANT